ncbi:DUF58 domain-containing protein [Sporosarcina sp. CAU 1771]
MKKIGNLLAAYSRFLFVLFVLASVFSFAMFQGGKVSWTIFYVLIPFIAYSLLLFFYPLSTVTAERIILTPTVQKGGKYKVAMTVKRTSRFPLLYVVLTEKYEGVEIPNLAGDKLKHFFVFGFKNEVHWEYEVQNMPRGEHVIQGVQMELLDFFGWIRKVHFIEIVNSVIVYPKITDIDYVPMATQYERGVSVSPLNIVKDTTMATGVRDYQTGDRMSWIHWKSFARTQTLMTKEFEDRRSQELFIVLDGRASDVFEEQVELTASIVRAVSNHQAGLGLVTTGSKQTVFPFIQTEEEVQRVLTHLAKVKPVSNSSVNYSTGFGSELQQASTMVVITGNPDWAFIQSVVQRAMNIRSVICFVVRKKDDKKSTTLHEDIEKAEKRGVTIRLITPQQFSDAFKEVVHL